MRIDPEEVLFTSEIAIPRKNIFSLTWISAEDYKRNHQVLGDSKKLRTNKILCVIAEQINFYFEDNEETRLFFEKFSRPTYTIDEENFKENPE
jgi:hypothetical protein